MINIIRAGSNEEQAWRDSLKLRLEETGKEIDLAAAAIINDVKKRGIDAVKEYSLKFDNTQPYVITKETIDTAYRESKPETIAALKKAAENIRAYQQKLLTKTAEWKTENGAVLGQIVRPLERIGIYVPGGTASYPSSVMMNAIPAKVAGVSEIIMVTPPTENLSKTVLAASKIAGIDKIIAVGGVQAIAALAFGADFIPKVDKIVGPGNAYVAAAKRMVFGNVDIDMIAGPSEILIIADGSTSAEFTAADLLSQAEHDKLSGAILLTDSCEFAKYVAAALERQLKLLPREDIARSSLENFGAVIVCEDLFEACRIANDIAPEHLEIMAENPRKLLPLIKNAGAVFLGAYSPEPLGDYMAGPSHVLPTSGTARFFSPLSADSFLKRMSVIEFTRETLGELHRDIINLAEIEGLAAHAKAVGIRFEEEVL